MPDIRIDQTAPAGVYGRYLTLEERTAEGGMPESLSQLPASRRGERMQMGTGRTAQGNDDPSHPMDCLIRDMLQEECEEEPLQKLIRSELNQELTRHSTDTMPRNRWLVNELYQRLVGADPLPRAELLRFLRGVASAVREELTSLASRQVTVSASDASTLGTPIPQVSAGSRVISFRLAANQPMVVLAQLDRWQTLAQSTENDERWLAELFAFADYAGRSVEELVDLFDRPEEEIRTQLALAEAFIRGE